MGPRALGTDLPDGQRQKGFTESRSTTEILDAGFAPRRTALVIGADRYEDPAFPALKWAQKDAAEVGRILEDSEYGGFDRVVSLVGPQARRDRILAELVSLKNDLRRQDTLVVYISAHGTMSIDAQGDPVLYIVAADTRPGNLRGTAVELGALQQFFSEIRAERKALILDACYNGREKSTLSPTVRQRVERMTESPVLSRKVRLGESEAHLFASTFGTPAREDDQLGHGVYTYHLLEAMTWSRGKADTNGDQVISIYEAHDYARAGTLDYTTGAQVPEAYFRMVGRSDLVLAGKIADREASQLGAVYFYGSEDEDYDGAVLYVDGRQKGSFPGTLHVPAGRSDIRIVGRTGTVLQHRVLNIRAGEALAADALMESPREHNGFLGGGPRLRFPVSASLRPLVGRAYLGVELRGGYRFMGPVRGLTLHGGVGYAPHQARFEDGASVTYEARHILWGEAGVGYRMLLPAGFLGLGYRARLQGITPLDGPGCDGIASCEGWLYVVQGLALEQGIALGRRWTLLLQEDVGITLLDLGGGKVEAGVDLGILVGIEVGL